jgi:hypothetical protein
MPMAITSKKQKKEEKNSPAHPSILNEYNT